MTTTRLLGQAFGPVLAAVPVGLLWSTAGWDVVYLVSGRTLWAQISFWTLVGGLLSGLVAALPWALRWNEQVPGSLERRQSSLQGALWLVVASLFLIGASIRAGGGYARPPQGAIGLGWMALSVAAAAAWLRAEAALNSEKDVTDRPGAESLSVSRRLPPPIPAQALR